MVVVLFLFFFSVFFCSLIVVFCYFQISDYGEHMVMCEFFFFIMLLFPVCCLFFVDNIGYTAQMGCVTICFLVIVCSPVVFLFIIFFADNGHRAQGATVRGCAVPSGVHPDGPQHGSDHPRKLLPLFAI